MAGVKDKYDRNGHDAEEKVLDNPRRAGVEIWLGDGGYGDPDLGEEDEGIAGKSSP